MLLGEGPYEGQTNQIDFPVAVYTAAAHHAWRLLPVRGDIGGSLASIQQNSDEPYQSFVDRLLIAASRILGKSDTGSPFIMQLAYENASFSFSMIFNFLAIFHVLQWTFLNFTPFSVFLAIFMY